MSDLDSPLWGNSNKLNFIKIGSLDAEIFDFKDWHLIYKNWLFSISSDPILMKFSFLESFQKGEPESDIRFIITTLGKELI